MRLTVFFLLTLLIASCRSHKTELIYHSDPVKVSKKHFDACVVNTNPDLLLDRPIPKKKIYFDYQPLTKNKTGCEGIYYYRYFTRPIKSLRFRDSSGMTYQRYSLFIILENQLIPLSNWDQQSREQFYASNKKQLEDTFGKDIIGKYKVALMNGYINFY